MTRPIVFLTDYGLDDEFVGVCHGVITRIAPGARSSTSRTDPAARRGPGAVLASAVPFMPEDSVYLAVVDPGVGGARGAIAVATQAGALLVGPDNGLLSLAWQELGGPIQAVAEPAWLHAERVLATFHGRDVFAPAAAHLANVADLTELGPEVELDSLQHVHVPAPGVAEGEIAVVVTGVDRFGTSS